MRLIDADELELDACWDEYDDGFTAYSRFQIEDSPTVDAIPVRNGQWVFVGEETMHDGWTYRKYRCTECDFETVEAKNFCQNCGAKMNGGNHNG